jgi:arylsulfatase A-like enzyme
MNTPRPNVIWLFGDQHRMQAMSCMGDPNVNTPHLDRLAAEGLLSTGAVAGCPLCCPYRGSLLTSQYPHKCVPGHEDRMPPEMPTIARPLKDAGYHTAYFGKWHLDGWKEREGRAAMHIIPPERRGGFDTWIGYENNNSQWDCWVHGGQGPEAFHHRLNGYETDALTDLLLDYLKRRAKSLADGSGKPFFAVLSVQPPHDPYVAPAPWMERHNPQRLEPRPNVPRVPRVEERARRGLAGAYAMIENLDSNVGRIREALAQTGLADNTHIVFFSDHGDLHGSQGQFAKTAPWEEAIRIPSIISGGDLYSQKRGREHLLVNHVDVAPTTLGLCGIDKPSWMAGTDYSSHRLRNRPAASEPDSAFLQLVRPTKHGDSIDRPWRGIVTRDGWKYVCLEGQPWLMFDLNEDPFEQSNLAHNTRFAAQRKKLHDRLSQWIADTGDAFALPEV